MKDNEICMSYPKALGDRFRALCVKHGYTYQGKPSPKAFFRAFTGGEWQRKPLAKAPVTPRREFPGGQTAAVVTPESYTVLAKRTRHYKTFGHLIQDIVAGNWVRVTKREEAA